MHATRMKISTTVAPETHEYLERLVKNGRAANMAEAIDQTVTEARRAGSIKRLEHDTAAYFLALSGKIAAEESRLEKALSQMADEVSFDE